MNNATLTAPNSPWKHCWVNVCILSTDWRAPFLDQETFSQSASVTENNDAEWGHVEPARWLLFDQSMVVPGILPDTPPGSVPAALVPVTHCNSYDLSDICCSFTKAVYRGFFFTHLQTPEGGGSLPQICRGNLQLSKVDASSKFD